MSAECMLSEGVLAVAGAEDDVDALLGAGAGAGVDAGARAGDAAGAGADGIDAVFDEWRTAKRCRLKTRRVAMRSMFAMQVNESCLGVVPTRRRVCCSLVDL